MARSQNKRVLAAGGCYQCYQFYLGAAEICLQTFLSARGGLWDGFWGCRMRPGAPRDTRRAEGGRGGGGGGWRGLTWLSGPAAGRWGKPRGLSHCQKSCQPWSQPGEGWGGRVTPGRSKQQQTEVIWQRHTRWEQPDSPTDSDKNTPSPP